MKDRRNEIDEEIRHLKRLASAITDQKTLDGIKGLIADLEAEKADLDETRGATPGPACSRREGPIANDAPRLTSVRNQAPGERMFL